MYKIMKLAAVGAAVVGLSGCASAHLSQAWDASGPTAKQTAALKGRAFVVGTVTTAPDVAPKAGSDEVEHCLPDSMYAQMLRADLVKAFARSGLTDGRQPAVKVDVAIDQRAFRTNVGLKASNFALKVKFANVKTELGLAGAGARGWFNEVPSWRRQQRIIPAMVVKLTNDLVSVKEGKLFSSGAYDGLNARGVESYFGASSFLSGWKPVRYADVPTWDLSYPMSAAEVERDTGKTAVQLSAICKANIAASK